jgi:hypothetical protein
VRALQESEGNRHIVRQVPRLARFALIEVRFRIVHPYFAAFHLIDAALRIVGEVLAGKRKRFGGYFDASEFKTEHGVCPYGLWF